MNWFKKIWSSRGRHKGSPSSNMDGDRDSRFFRFVILCGFGFGVAGHWMIWCQASEPPPISTERPTVGYSPDLIPGGSLQFENGSNVLFQKAQYAADLPETLVRLGLTDRFETRFLISNAVYPSSAGKFESADAACSAKVLLAGPNTRLPKSAILSLSFPTGSPSQTSGSYDPSLTLIWTQAASRGYFFNEVAGATLTTLNGARRPVWLPSVVGGRALSSKLSIFAEYAPTVLQDRNVVHVVDGGFAVTIRRLQQIDVRSGWQQDTAGAHGLFSLGYSLRSDSLFGERRRLRDEERAK
jgi:hypothetical protein